MQFALFYHSLLSDWNHGNAHFLRGIVSELLSRGHTVRVFEPENAWSLQNLLAEPTGQHALHGFYRAYPGLQSIRYNLENFDLESALDGADLVLVHEWNDHELVRRIGEQRAQTRAFQLLFHDTHHRAVTDRASMAAYDLTHYDGVLAFGKTLRDLYLQEAWTPRAWTWHEAADTRVFRPLGTRAEGLGIRDKGLEPDELLSSNPYSLFPDPSSDLVWIGNWGDNERTAELQEFLLEPVHELRLQATVFGVRYPESAKQALKEAGIEYAGWLPNYLAPEVFARFRMTVHVPRRPYVEALPGIPTIRVFEALACGIPLVSAPWEDTEHLFTPGQDFLTARNGKEMTEHLRMLQADTHAAQELAWHGLATIRARHTCAHRVDELLAIYAEMGGRAAEEEAE